MPNHDIAVGRDYEAAVFERLTTTNEQWVSHHRVNWADQPSKFTIYTDAERLSLSDRAAAAGRLSDALSPDADPSLPLTYDRLSQLLFLTNGVFSRRTDLDWNLDHRDRLSHLVQTFGRPSASGGGMYPFEPHVVAGPAGTLAPGVYHYANAHHALGILRRGDWTDHVRRAVGGHPWAADATDFIVVSLNFWKNSYRYATFCYHVVTQDIGAYLATLQLVARSVGVRARVLLWFADHPLNELLGVDGVSESVFAVVALGRRADPDAPVRRDAPAPLSLKAYQRSKAVIRFPLVETMHRAAMIDDDPRPPAEISREVAVRIDRSESDIMLPPVDVDSLALPLAPLLRQRTSSWGSFIGSPPMSLEDLGRVLYCGACGQRWPSDMKGDDDVVRFTRMSVFVSHVRGLVPGAYDYHPDLHSLSLRDRGSFGPTLQAHYFLNNYNLEQAAVVIVVIGALDRALQAYGNRGVRVLNADVGMTAQHLYVGCSALGLGCGAMLGFDNGVVNRLACIGDDEQSLLIVAAGPQHPKPMAFDYRLD